jgi:hypothetical protein
MSTLGICYFLSGGGVYYYELPNGVNVVPKWNGRGDVLGCGLLLNPENKVAIFFTMNGMLLGKLNENLIFIFYLNYK